MDLTTLWLCVLLRAQRGRVRVGGLSPWTLRAAALEGHVQAGGADGGDDPVLQPQPPAAAQRQQRTGVRRQSGQQVLPLFTLLTFTSEVSRGQVYAAKVNNKYYLFRISKLPR